MSAIAISSGTLISAVTWVFLARRWTRAPKSKRKLSAPSYPYRRRDRGWKKLRTGHALETAIAGCLRGAVLLAVSAFMCANIANAGPLRIVAVGASNTHGWYVGNQGAYPAQLQALLKAKGIDAHVTNAGVPFDTTAMMLRRIDIDVPNGTDIAILQPGGNDLRFF